MSKYLLQVSYSTEGAKGLLKDGGSKRVEAAKTAAEAVGGKVEAMYFAFGGTDAFAIMDLPDHASAAALALTASGAGAGNITTTVLLTPKELDEASGKSVVYKPPGQ